MLRRVILVARLRVRLMVLRSRLALFRGVLVVPMQTSQVSKLFIHNLHNNDKDDFLAGQTYSN